MKTVQTENKTLAETAYRAFCARLGVDPQLPLGRTHLHAWGAFAGVAQAGAATPSAYEAYRLVCGAVGLPHVHALRDVELRSFRAAVQAAQAVRS